MLITLPLGKQFIQYSLKAKAEVEPSRQDDLKPGDQIIVDQYESTILGQLWGSQGRTKDKQMHKGGTILVDHTSGLLHVEHQILLNATDMICSKILFE